MKNKLKRIEYSKTIDDGFGKMKLIFSAPVKYRNSKPVVMIRGDSIEIIFKINPLTGEHKALAKKL